MEVSKQVRLAEVFRRLEQLPAAATELEALGQLEVTLNEVEDEMSGVPFSPSEHASDGRMYPPEADSRRTVADHPLVFRYRSRGHNTFISSKGAIEIRLASVPAAGGELVYEKPGADGSSVWA